MNHKKTKLDDRNKMWFFIYFLVLLSLGWLVRDAVNQPSLWATLAEMVNPQSGTHMSDPKSFAMGAMDVYQHGMVTEANAWVIRLWPPGFMFLEGYILKLFGLNVSIIFVLLILASLTGAFMLIILRKNLMPLVHPAVATLLPLLPFAFPLPRFFLLQPNGLILGESFAIMFFFTGLLLMPLALRHRSVRLAIGAGVLLALSAYFRSQFELIVVVLSAGAVCLGLLLVYLLLARKQDEEQRSHRKWTLLVVAVALLTANLSMLPWRVQNYRDPYVVNMSWVQTSQLIYINASKTNKELEAIGGAWIVLGGGNIACNVEPGYCGKPGKDGFYQALMKHPGQWFGMKLPLLSGYWFSSPSDLGGIERPSTFFENVFNLFYLLCLIATIPLLWMVRRHRSALLYAWICGSFYACFVAVFSLVHLETRYFFVMKIFAMFSTIVFSCLAWAMRHSRTGEEEGVEVAGKTDAGTVTVPTVPLSTVGTVSAKPDLSVVLVIENEESALKKLHARLVATLTPLSSHVEILLIDISGSQRCWQDINQLAAADPRVVGLQLSHNLTPSYAYQAGLDHSRGNWMVLMDSDGFAQPEDIARLYAKARAGHAFVAGKHVIQQDALIQRCQSWIAHQVFGQLAAALHERSNGNFCIMSRQAVRESGGWIGPLSALEKRLQKMGFASTTINIGQPGVSELSAGNPAPILSNRRGAAYKPMLLVAGGGMLMAALAFICGIGLIWQMVLHGSPFSPWSGVSISLYFIGGLVISLLGLIGASLCALSDEVRHVPKYSVRRTTGNLERITVQAVA